MTEQPVTAVKPPTKIAQVIQGAGAAVNKGKMIVGDRLRPSVEQVKTSFQLKTEAGQKHLADRVAKIPTLADIGRNNDGQKQIWGETITPKGMVAEAQALISTINANEQSPLIRAEKAMIVAGGSLEVAMLESQPYIPDRIAAIKTLAALNAVGLKTVAELPKNQKYDYSQLEGEANAQIADAISRLLKLEENPITQDPTLQTANEDLNTGLVRKDYFKNTAESTRQFDEQTLDGERDPFRHAKTPSGLIRDVLAHSSNVAMESVEPDSAKNRLSNLFDAASDHLSKMPATVVDSNHPYDEYSKYNYDSARLVIEMMGTEFKTS